MEENKEITVKDMEELCEAIVAKRDESDKAAAAKKAIDDELFGLEQKAMSYLQQLELTSYKSKVCTVAHSVRYSFKTPKTPEQKAAFFEYLKQKGLYDTAVTVNSQWLNGFCKKEIEAETAAGNLLFEIPGLDAPSSNEYLSVRGK